MKRTGLLFICLFTSTVIAAEIPQKGTVAKTWKPTAFALKTDRLPAGYTGLEPKKFFTMFESKLNNLTKGEFESSEEFAQRTANKDSLLAPINTSDLYAFRIPNFFHQYDADTQAYTINKPVFCTTSREDSDWVTCEVARSEHEDTYTGGNSYGAYRTVERRRGNSLSLAIAKDSPLLGSVLPSKSASRFYNYRDNFTVPLEKARNLKNVELSVLFVGRISHAQLIKGRGVISKPTINDPTDIYITEEAIPFDIIKIIYYVVKTGEILGQRDF